MTINPMQLIAALLTTVVVLGLYHLLRPRRPKVGQLSRWTDPGAQDSAVIRKDLLPQPTAKSWASQIDESFERAVERTGLEISAGGMVAMTLLLGLVFAGAAHLWRGNMYLSVAAALVGFLIPMGVVMIMQANYRRSIQKTLPDAYYLIARSLRAGLPLENAIAYYAQQSKNYLADEFHRCTGQIKLGLPVGVALVGVAERIRLQDFDVFVSTVRLHQTTGGNLPLLLDRLATNVRDRNLFRSQFLAVTALGRVTAIFLAAAAPLLTIGYLLWEPEHVQAFMNSNRGITILVVCFLLEIIGALWLWRILKIDY
jgi:tight adherence protein B